MLRTSRNCRPDCLVRGALCSSRISATTQPKARQVEFVQVAKNVAFKDGVLTLGDALPMTIFFSDRPERLTGQLRNDLFAKLWNEGKNGFKNDPPNAALTVFNPEGKPKQAIVVLTNPRLDGNISCSMPALKGDIPAQGGESALFIDGYQTPCNSGLNNPAFGLCLLGGYRFLWSVTWANPCLALLDLIA